MKKQKPNERKEWENADIGHKSYTTGVLHYFHFRPKLIPRSWKHEEVITWELIRALDVLPRKYFLKELLEGISIKSPSISGLLYGLIKDSQKVNIVSYPLLGLSGNKKNSRCDIGLILNDSCLWIEAKSCKWDKKHLDKEINQQKTAPNLVKYKNHAVIALLPDYQDYDGVRFSWHDLVRAFEKASEKLKHDYNDSAVLAGYLKISDELVNRIKAMGI